MPERPPTPNALLKAFRTLRMLSFTVGPGQIGDDLWASVVEGRRAIAVTTDYLSKTTEDESLADEYAQAWDRMNRVYGKKS